jgi:histone-binding protein RBBP4
LISAGFDHIIAHWDIAAASKENRILDPLRAYNGHTAGVMVNERVYDMNVN